MINVELSNIWSCVSLPDLLSREKEIFDAHLHLRTNTSNEEPCFGWLGQPETITARMIHHVISSNSASGKWPFRHFSTTLTAMPVNT